MSRGKKHPIENVVTLLWYEILSNAYQKLSIQEIEKYFEMGYDSDFRNIWRAYRDGTHLPNLNTINIIRKKAPKLVEIFESNLVNAIRAKSSTFRGYKTLKATASKRFYYYNQLCFQDKYYEQLSVLISHFKLTNNPAVKFRLSNHIYRQLLIISVEFTVLNEESPISQLYELLRTEIFENYEVKYPTYPSSKFVNQCKFLKRYLLKSGIDCRNRTLVYVELNKLFTKNIKYLFPLMIFSPYKTAALKNLMQILRSAHTTGQLSELDIQVAWRKLMFLGTEYRSFY